MLDDKKLDQEGQALVRLGVLCLGLTQDREWVANHLDVEDEYGSSRRAYVRIMLSFIEGMMYAYKDLLLVRHSKNNEVIGLAEAMILRELQFNLTDSGKAKIQTRLIPLKDNVQFTVRLLGKVASPPFEPDFGGIGFRAFSAAINIRNRVTHPRSHVEMRVSDDEIKTVERAVRWFEYETARYLNPESASEFKDEDQ